MGTDFHIIVFICAVFVIICVYYAEVVCEVSNLKG